MADSPAAPAVSSFDPVEWTKKIKDLEAMVAFKHDENAEFLGQMKSLRTELGKAKSEAADARNALKTAQGRIRNIEDFAEKNLDLKELKRLRAEVAKMHAEGAKRERARAEEDKKTAAQIQDLTTRAIRAEGKFQALESTAAMMAQSRDNANASASQLMAERDQARAKADLLKEDLEQTKAELVKASADLRAKNVVPAAAGKAK